MKKKAKKSKRSETVLSQTQFRLLTWIGKQKKGVTVTDLAKRFKTSVQSAHVRLADAFKRQWLDRSVEDSSGPQERHRYRLSAEGKKLLARKWKKANKRFLIAA